MTINKYISQVWAGHFNTLYHVIKFKFKIVEDQPAHPYPLYCNSWKRIFLLAAIFAIVVPIFVYFFQPFTLNFKEHRFSFFVISLLSGLIVSLVFLVFTATLKILFPHGFREPTNIAIRTKRSSSFWTEPLK